MHYLIRYQTEILAKREALKNDEELKTAIADVILFFYRLKLKLFLNKSLCICTISAKTTHFPNTNTCKPI